MVGDRTLVAQQAAGRAPGRRPAGLERHLLDLALGRALAGSAGALWAYTTCYNRFNRWRKAGVWDRIMDAVTEAYDGDIQMIDSSVVRVHQHAANVKNATELVLWAAVEEDRPPRSMP